MEMGGNGNKGFFANSGKCIAKYVTSEYFSYCGLRTIVADVSTVFRIEQFPVSAQHFG